MVLPYGSSGEVHSQLFPIADLIAEAIGTGVYKATGSPTLGTIAEILSPSPSGIVKGLAKAVRGGGPPGSLGIFGKADASILSGLSKGIKDQVTAMQNIVSKNPDEFNKHYVHDPATGRNLFVDNRGELIVEYPDVVGKYAIGLGDKTEYTRSVFERNIPHPDPKAKELLSDTHLSVSPHNTATYFRSGEGFIKDKIEIKSGKKDRVYPTETDEYNRIRKALGETFNKNSTPGFDYMAASSARKKLSGEEEALRQRIADINERKNT